METRQLKTTENDKNQVLCRVRHVPYLPQTIGYRQATIRYGLFQKRHLPPAWDVLQELIEESAVGYMSNEVSSVHHLEEVIRGSDITVVLQDVSEEREEVVGLIQCIPFNGARSINPITHGVGIFIDKRMQRMGVSGDCYNLIQLFGITCGYLGVNSRTALIYYPMINAGMRRGGTITCIIPRSGVAVKPTPSARRSETKVDDANGFLDYTSYIKLPQMSEEEVLARAIANPLAPKEYGYTFQPLAIHESLSNGGSIRTASADQYREVYSMLVQAADAGDGFGIDECPTFDLFVKNFLHYSTLLCIDSKHGDLVGAAVVGPSLLCRGDNPELASVYIYIRPSYRRQGRATQTSNIISKALVEAGWTGILTQVLMTKNFPFQLMEKLGYINAGCMYYCAYVKGKGWASSAVYFKDLNTIYLKPELLEYLQIVAQSKL